MSELATRPANPVVGVSMQHEAADRVGRTGSELAHADTSACSFSSDCSSIATR